MKEYIGAGCYRFVGTMQELHDLVEQRKAVMKR